MSGGFSATPRLQLSDDEKFLNFRCAMIHPVMWSDKAEVGALLDTSL